MGIIFTLLGIFATYRLWENHFGMAIIVIIATIYQASSLVELFKEKNGKQSSDRWQTTINMISSFVIIGFLIFSFFT